MIARRSLAILAALFAPAVVAAQACTGGITPAEINTRNTYAGGTLDLVSNANAFGGRVGGVANKNGREIALLVGLRSISAGTTSILAGGFGYSMDIVKKPNAKLCAIVDVDLVNLSDSENGTSNVMFGVGYGSPRKSASGTTTLLPFGVLGGNLSSANGSETAVAEFSLSFEIGIGFRLASGLTLTPSFRQSLETGADPVIRFAALFPLSTKPMK